jgi:intracellular sulfur oxidation DsrE/DsrF family protein
MKKESRKLILSLILSTCLAFVATTHGFAADYESLKGLKSVKAVFDVRISNPKSAALNLKVIYDTYKDESIMAVTKKPAFVVIFIGPSVKLMSKNKEGFSPEEQKSLDEIANTISIMAKDGIRIEICLVAANIFGVDPGSFLPGIKPVPNGWVSLIGYETKGYSLVPAY